VPVGRSAYETVRRGLVQGTGDHGVTTGWSEDQCSDRPPIGQPDGRRSVLPGSQSITSSRTRDLSDGDTDSRELECATKCGECRPRGVDLVGADDGGDQLVELLVEGSFGLGDQCGSAGGEADQ
jgi:hypothetical protein